MKQRGAFTLVELLVVAATIFILAGLALPAIGKAKHKVRAIICQNNLKQWGAATELYSSDNDDYLPLEGIPNPTDASTNSGWYISLPRELGLAPYHSMAWRTNADVDPGTSIWICPANSRRTNGRNLFHYCLNSHVNGTGEENRSIRRTAIAHPVSVVWMFDSKNLPAVGYWAYTHTNLHNGGAQFLFLDGHVRWFPREAYWDLTRNRGRIDNPELVWIP